MSIDPVTGLNTINNLIKMSGYQIPVDAPIIHWLTRKIVARELNMLFTRLRNEDLILSFEDLEKFDEEDIDKICFSRGIRID